MTKRYMEKLEEERRAKEERLLDLPEDLGDTTVLVEELQEHIRDLRATIDHDRTWQSKLLSRRGKLGVSYRVKVPFGRKISYGFL